MTREGYHTGYKAFAIVVAAVLVGGALAPLIGMAAVIMS